MRKRINRSFAILFILLMMFAMTGSAEGEGQTVDRLGSVTIRLEDTKHHRPKENVVFHVTKVADVINGEYVMEEAYAESGIDLNQVKTANDMEAVCKILEPIVLKDLEAVTDKEGVAVIPNLPVGVYFIHAVDIAEYEQLTSFLVSIPTWNETKKVMEYDVEAFPKHAEIIGTIITEIPDDFREGVQTGDMSGLMVWFDLAVISLFSIWGILVYKFAKQNKKYGERK